MLIRKKGKIAFSKIPQVNPKEGIIAQIVIQIAEKEVVKIDMP